MNAEQIAQEIHSRFGSACTDIAYEKPWEDSWNKKAVAWAKKARRNGCRDLQGAYADVLYNDTDMARDFLGDWLCDAAGNDDVLHDQAVEALQKLMSWLPASVFTELRRVPA